MHPNLFSLITISIIFFTKASFSDPRATEAALICTNTSTTGSDRPIFVSNFLATLDTLTPLISSQRYGRAINGTGNYTVYSFGECMKDLSQTDCDLCFAQCKTQILRCLPFQKGTRGGQLFYDGCYLRYDEYDFFGDVLGLKDEIVCGGSDFSGGSSNVGELVRNLSVEAVKNDGFEMGFVGTGNLTVYGLAQCWEFVNKSGCEECLGDAVSGIGFCVPNGEGRVLKVGCYLRYSAKKFYNNSTNDFVGRSRGRRRTAAVLAITFSAIAFVLLIALVVFRGKRKITKQRRERKQLGSLLDSVNKSELNFSYETLEKATDYFNISNKLGQGASGSVFKGVLPNGNVIAIKRLFFNTRQWVDHFFNEVNLISGLHHKNLVKLLGCSITGPESLLVYEYVQNHSLNDYLFGKLKHQVLIWEVRYKILLGTAEGLVYLHEGSRLRIIHRDIKLSNILLDADFNPKIADFGLARLFPEDNTHISATIAGTLGYMAPEYVTRGKLSEKADIYSFGVLIIELVSGKRNNTFSHESISVLQLVWDLHGAGRLVEAVDPALEGRFEEEQASRILKIGLLCVQASPELRPSTPEVVKMLSEDTDSNISEPTKPPFLSPINVGNAELRELMRRGSRSHGSQPSSYTQSSRNSMTQSWIEPR